MIVMYQLDQMKIPWDLFISNDIFTTPPSQHDLNTPSSSHPPTSIPPSHPTIHTSLPSHLQSPHSPHIDTSSSPFYNPTSSSQHDSETSISEEDIEAAWAILVED